MVIKKKVLEELQKFNKDLEKHLPNLNLDYLKNQDIFSRESQIGEVVPLLANNLMDLKTEVSLIRRNLVDSVEGMVLRLISEQQQIFANQMDKVFTQMLVEMKGNFSSYISEISNGMSSIKKDLNELKIENNKLSSKFENFNSMMIELRSVIENVKSIKSEVPILISESLGDIKNLNSSILRNIELQLNNLDSQFNSLKVDFNNIYDKEEDDFKKDLVNNFSKKFLEVSNRNIELEKNLDKIASGMNLINGTLRSNSNNLVEIDNEFQKVIENKTFIRDLESKDLKKSFSSSENIQKLISIEDRIRKLDSLK